MLKVADLYCERDERVLFSELRFMVQPGEVWQIQGANGSGKTTLLRILCGLNEDYSGEISWLGESVTQNPDAYRNAMFYLGHSPAINKTLSPLQNLRWFCAAYSFADDEAIFAALAEQGLSGYEHVLCYQMSAGQQRRVSLARLQLSPAQLWILDEPFTALDRQGVKELEARVASKIAAGGSVILTTHHPLQLSCPVQVVNLDELAANAVEAN